MPAVRQHTSMQLEKSNIVDFYIRKIFSFGFPQKINIIDFLCSVNLSRNFTFFMNLLRNLDLFMMALLSSLVIKLR